MDTINPIDIECPSCGSSEYLSFDEDYDNEWKNWEQKVIEMIKDYDENLLEIRPTPAEIIFNWSGENYNIEDYVADIIQFLSCEDVVKNLKEFIGGH